MCLQIGVLLGFLGLIDGLQLRVAGCVSEHRPHVPRGYTSARGLELIRGHRRDATRRDDRLSPDLL